jgi:hypothetical protein
MKIKSSSRMKILLSVLFITGVMVLLQNPDKESQNESIYKTDLDQRVKVVESTQQAPFIKDQRVRKTLEDFPSTVDLFSTLRLPPDASPEQFQGAELPALPYLYMGKMIDAGIVTIFLRKEDNKRPFLAQVGDVLDEQYRIELIDSRQIEFIYMPLGRKQFLVMPEGGNEIPLRPTRGIQNMDEINARLRQVIENGVNQ